MAFTLRRIPPPILNIENFPRRCAGVARQVANAYGLRGQAVIDDLTSSAYIRALRLARDFSPRWPDGYRDPDAAFWGWGYREIKTECQREAARIMGGGTFHSPRRNPGQQPVYARPISDYSPRDDNDDQAEFAAPAPDDNARPEIRPHLFASVIRDGQRLAQRYMSYLALTRNVLATDQPAECFLDEEQAALLLEWEDERGRNRLEIDIQGQYRFLIDGITQHVSN